METNSKEFLTEQYHDSSKLEARINIHELYSTNKQDWHEWIFQNISLPEHSSVVEFGCGSGVLWKKNLAKLDSTIRVLATDYSEGMLGKAKQAIGDHPSFMFRQMDVQQVELEPCTVDIVIANHMLYHVPNIHKALSEIQRILKPSGVFYASANGFVHFKEMYVYVSDFDSSLPFTKPMNAQYFGLETGLRQLEACFDEVNLLRFDSHLEIPHAEELANFIFSIGPALKDHLIARGQLDAFIQYLDEQKDNRGLITITKDVGLFVCKSPKHTSGSHS